jgi:hypothetical protein
MPHRGVRSQPPLASTAASARRARRRFMSMNAADSTGVGPADPEAALKSQDPGASATEFSEEGGTSHA